ncbi:NADAR family protein, partial [candidate division WOR-3 bacterium]|nr:NADAR family protein [candidate division WOR-3 bacterium]
MKKIVEVKNDRYFVMGCMNITLKSFMPCSSCGYWKDDKCESPDPEGELADMNQIIKGRWEIMKFDIPHDEVQLDVMPHSTNKPTESKENKEWWFCNKNGIMVYDQMCYDSCFIDEIIACPDVKNKPQKTIAEEHIPSQTKREPAYSDGKLVGCGNFEVITGKFKGDQVLCHQCLKIDCPFEKTIKVNDIDKIGFYIRNKPYGFMSNFWRAEQTIGGITYPTNEHYYQSMKAKDPKIREWIANSPKAWNSMKAGRSLRENEMHDDWDEYKVDFMLTGLRAKFQQNEDLKKMLLETGDAHLYGDSPID